MMHNSRPYVLEDVFGNPILVLRSTSIRGAALRAARRGIRDIRVRVRECKKGTTVFRYEARKLARPGKFSNERHLKVSRKASYHRDCGIPAYLAEDQPSPAVEVVQGGGRMASECVLYAGHGSFVYRSRVGYPTSFSFLGELVGNAGNCGDKWEVVPPTSSGGRGERA